MNTQRIQGIIAFVAFILAIIVASIGFLPTASIPQPAPVITVPTTAPTAQHTPPPLVIPTPVLVGMGVCASTPQEAVVRTIQTTPRLDGFGVQIQGTFAFATISTTTILTVWLMDRDRPVSPLEDESRQLQRLCL